MMPNTDNWTPHYAGDRCLVLEFGNTIDKHIVDQVVALRAIIAAASLSDELVGVLETVPTFRSLAVVYDPLLIHPDALVNAIRALSNTRDSARNQSKRRLILPVQYGGESGPDLQDVARMTHLDEQTVIELHQKTEFTVYMLGFLPGFAFLGDTPAELHLPRRQEPRIRVPAGSVAIAMQLTGIYPWDSPGGWHIIGRCPIALFNGNLSPPTVFEAGDTVSFRAIDANEFNDIKLQNDNGSFHRASLLDSTGRS